MGLILCQRTWKWEKNTCLQIYVHIYVRKYRNGNTFLIQKKSATRKQTTIWNMDAYTFSFEIAVCFYFDISCCANFNNNIWNIKCLCGSAVHCKWKMLRPISNWSWTGSHVWLCCFCGYCCGSIMGMCIVICHCCEKKEFCGSWWDMAYILYVLCLS